MFLVKNDSATPHWYSVFVNSHPIRFPHWGHQKQQFQQIRNSELLKKVSQWRIVWIVFREQIDTVLEYNTWPKDQYYPKCEYISQIYANIPDDVSSKNSILEPSWIIAN